MQAKQAAEPNLMEGATESLSQTAQTVQETTQQAIPEQLRVPQWAGVHLLDFALALGVIVATLLLRWFINFILEHTVGVLVRRRGGELAQKLLEGLLWLFGVVLLMAGLFFALSMVQLPAKPVNWVGGVWRGYNSLVIIVAAMLAYRIIDAALRFLGRRRGEAGVALTRSEVYPLARDMLKVLLAVGALVLIIQSWGHDATTLLAGVGIGGLALAFAAQDTVANVFGSLMIYTDKPFKTGDWVEYAGVTGIVEEIGIRSTRVRTFDKCLVSIPNKTVTTEKLSNWGAMTYRRIRWHLNVGYSTPPELLETLLSRLRELVAGHEHVVPQMWLVQLESLSSHSLDILVQAYLYITEYQPFLECQEQLILKIIRLFNELGVEFAFPTQTLYHRVEEPLRLALHAAERGSGADEAGRDE